uniref:NADH dehydrogenase [ubiquinone] 1 alpha subcomplex subunit 8 n=1 Tax=Caenorhabditis tropicalis TaxID=1561998 RepID=A0A1I7TB96_9PELO
MLSRDIKFFGMYQKTISRLQNYLSDNNISILSSLKLQAQFVRDWAAHCVDKHLPKYDAQEIGPEIRKCDTERCVYFMYKYIADNRPEFFTKFDICFETNTAKKTSRSPARNPDQHYDSRRFN